MRTLRKTLAGLALLSLASATWANTAPQTASTTGKWVTGYYGGYFWDHSTYQAPQHVDMTAMTHFVFARIGPGGGQGGGNPGEIVLGSESAQTERERGPGMPYEKTVEEYLIMRAHQVGTKALIMLGGEGDNSGFHRSSLPDVRPTFVKNLVDYMVAKDYDGIDVDWEGIQDWNTEDQGLLEALIADLRKEANSRPRYQDKPVIITYPAGVLNPNTDQVKEHHKRLAALVDQYNFMSYGMGWFNQGWHTSTFAPLTPASNGARPSSIAGTMKMYEDAGVPRSKLGMGLGFYGMNYKPPFSQPGQATDGYPMSDFSFTDTMWNWALLNKLGYLDRGNYVWEPETQTSYRSYPGGYSPAGRPETISGYISYEEPATIAAKGAWALSSKAGEGAAGTIIWLVNYGTTDGVNNPLLTAVKKAFLDPNATEPGPYPNPLPDLPPPVIVDEMTITADWGTGYCADVKVTNTGGSAGAWTLVKNPFNDTISSLWGGTYKLENKVLTVKGAGYNENLRIGRSTQFGYCATRPVTPPQDVPPPPPGSIKAEVSVTADWTSGYCAKVAVTNTATTKAVRWAVQVPNIQGTLTSFWGGKHTMDGTTMNLSGPDWNPDLAPGATNGDVGFCAKR
jgi:GH18 family chitinase